jgi:phytoene synthase
MRDLQHRARPLLDVIEGCQMDLQPTRYFDFAELQRYCLVAGVVGEVSARIFGQTDPATTAYAHAWPGVSAHQHHPRRGRGRAARAHLPAGERAAALRGAAHEILKGEYSERFAALMRFQAQRARPVRRGAQPAARGPRSQSPA